MQWNRFDSKRGPQKGGAAVAPVSGDPNRFLRELNTKGPRDERGDRKPIPKQSRNDLDQQLSAVLNVYDDTTKRSLDKSTMDSLVSKVLTAQQEYALSAEALDSSRRGLLGIIGNSLSQILIFLLDWALFIYSLFLVFSAITEKWRPSPEPILIVGAAAFFGFFFAVLIKTLAHNAAKHEGARYGYWVPFAGAIAADLFFLKKQGNLPGGFLLTGVIVALAFVNYFGAKDQKNLPKSRRLLLQDYSDKYSIFSQHYFLFEKNLQEMRANPHGTVVRGHTFVISDKPQGDANGHEEF